MRVERQIARWLLKRAPLIRRIAPRQGAERARVDHIVILDGTNSNLIPGEETNAGILYKLLRETAPAPNLNLHYEGGVPWDSWRSTAAVISGHGINDRIQRAYGAIASRYQPGDRIFLFGFSRGGYAVRSLAGIIGMVGLLKSTHATERNVTQVFRHYEVAPAGSVAEAFRKAHCHSNVQIDLIGAWDTVKSLGLRVPVLWRLTEARYEFHNHELGDHVLNGFHALALDERREAFTPVLWHTPKGFKGRCEQVWFRGAHGDIGGQLGGFNRARPRSNIALVWLLKKAETCGVVLPEGWDKRYEMDPFAPFVGYNSGWGRLFLLRRRRVVGADPSERLHPSVIATAEAGGRPAPDLPVATD